MVPDKKEQRSTARYCRENLLTQRAQNHLAPSRAVAVQ
jgi:hypothetical protein